MYYISFSNNKSRTLPHLFRVSFLLLQQVVLSATGHCVFQRICQQCVQIPHLPLVHTAQDTSLWSVLYEHDQKTGQPLIDDARLPVHIHWFAENAWTLDLFDNPVGRLTSLVVFGA
jgi:hypothetical protein